MQSIRTGFSWGLSAIAALALALIPVAACGADEVAGPVEATVMRVIDGDTFVAQAHIWPGQTVSVSVRIRGIDAPEIHSRCAAEKAAGQRARMALQAMLRDTPVRISNIGGGKYYGRVLADVTTASGRQVGSTLVREALARVYAGGRRVHYCG